MHKVMKNVKRGLVTKSPEIFIKMSIKFNFNAEQFVGV